MSTAFCSVKSGYLRSLLRVLSQRIPHTIQSLIKLSLSSLNSHVWALVFKSATYWSIVSPSCWLWVLNKWSFPCDFSPWHTVYTSNSPGFLLLCFYLRHLPMWMCCRSRVCPGQPRVVLSQLGFLLSSWGSSPVKRVQNVVSTFSIHQNHCCCPSLVKTLMCVCFIHLYAQEYM